MLINWGKISTSYQQVWIDCGEMGGWGDAGPQSRGDNLSWKSLYVKGFLHIGKGGTPDGAPLLSHDERMGFKRRVPDKGIR